MSTEGWVFMIGFRVFDLGLLVLWLVWFFRLRDDEDPPDEGGGGGDEGPDRGPGRGPGGGGLRLPLGRVPSGRRLRDHRVKDPRPRRRGPGPPVPAPLPSRVRHPRPPVPTHPRV